MLHFYKTTIIPVLEYACACPAWHNILNIEQSYRIESIQKRAIKIIYGPGDYHDICRKQSLPTLAIVVELKFVQPFLADRTNVRAYATVLRPSVVCRRRL